LLDMEQTGVEPRRIWWARPRKLCLLERPGGGGRNHRAERRAVEIAWLGARGVRLVISVMGSRHNLGAYEAAGLEWHHVPVKRPEDWAEALEELLPLIAHEAKRSGAVALHGDRHTDFVAAVGAAHLHEVRGVDPSHALARAVRAGLTVTPAACALIGVETADVEGLMQVA
jgi:hypothetical protein